MDTPQTPHTPELQPQVGSTDQPTTEVSISKLTAGELVEQLAVSLQGDTLPERKLIDAYRNAFVRLKGEAQASQDPERIEAVELQEDRLNDLVKQFQTLDAKRREELEALQRANAMAADMLLERLAKLLESEEEFRVIYDRFHELRKEWESYRPLSSQDEARLRKAYSELCDRFYELKNINEELRELDFRHNLEAKQAILSELRKLVELEDTRAALQQMEGALVGWYNIGPVGRDQRAEVKAEFKELTTTIYRRHQERQEGKRKDEQQNLDAKTALIERLESILTALPTKRSEWDKLTQTVKAIQEEWRGIGFAGRKANDDIYRRLRAGMDAFFQLKSEFYARTNSEQEANLKAKEVLVARARELKDSTDWAKTAEELKALQAQWRQIGSVPQRHSQRIWEEFRASFDYFFERRKEQGASAKGAEWQHLEDKRAILEELRALVAQTEVKELHVKLRTLGERWQAIGHVPFKHKDAINKEHKKLLDELYTRLRDDRSQRRLEGYSATLTGKSGDRHALEAERQRMERIRERIRTELRAYDSNLQILTISSKGASSVLKDIERKRQELEEDLRLVEEKISMIPLDDKQ